MECTRASLRDAHTQTIERPSDELQTLIASKGYKFLADMPGGCGEKIYVHDTFPGGVAAANERLQQLLKKKEG